MEHLKLFSARINIPRLIKACEEYHHWKELVFLYIQYDEYDNAALVMMSHSPVAWEHVQFKDVAVKVSNAEVYYKAITFYLEEHPELLTDLLKVGHPPWTLVVLTPSAFICKYCHCSLWATVHAPWRMLPYLCQELSEKPIFSNSAGHFSSFRVLADWICTCGA